MTLTKEQKKAKIEELRQQVAELKIQTFERWKHLMSADEQFRKACGYSNGAEDMLQKLVKDFDKEFQAMMKPFDRGDYD